MSYVALGTDSFDEVVHFYGQLLGFPSIDSWDRPRGRGQRFDLGGGLKLEILDNRRESPRLCLNDPGQRCHVVIEVDDIDVSRSRLAFSTPAPQQTSWGAKLLTLCDPDGVPVVFLEWTR